VIGGIICQEYHTELMLKLPLLLLIRGFVSCTIYIIQLYYLHNTVKHILSRLDTYMGT